jgi:Raf kinase inhibitor-like YbhB/YbcL family protein
VPKGTVELAITLEDPDAPSGTFVHWVAWGIDPTAGALPEETLPDGVIEGDPSYLGPCPPPGDPHRYRFTLYALDAPIELEAGVATIADLRAAIKGTVTGKAKLVGLYATESGTA